MYPINSRLLPLPQPVNYLSNSSISTQPQHHFNTLALHRFQSLKPYEICAIHRFTLISHLQLLIQQCDKVTTFSIHTTRANEDGTVRTIQIELIQPEESKSIVLLFEITHLSSSNTTLFMEIQKLLNTIFRQSKRFFIWSNKNRKDLDVFTHDQYLPNKIFEILNIIELQEPFKQWYIRTFKHDKNCSVPSFYKTDAICCTCPHRPYKNINDKWSLEKAINYVFNEFICESNENDRNDLRDIDHSVCYCLAITKLSMIIELDWTIEQLYQYKKFHQE
ncbi:unnamed protein product [Rotaria sordida]|uniref:Uncharacterized protein n=1 Tax=Rotaria sordida TaxID=392033 RepID=A0A819SJN5_9BILA|nr:unnamed protein product [Rotaria sordida]CAF1383652.1 unnamed protein product [Rotaria sordida]CAF1435051.1 unnamed protein product [Rotaria sordida]CAF4033898.1 unnamed protein product [Rotaria sordida]CAF4063146.1 unnamed protein product [Rotaria sordida]